LTILPGATLAINAFTQQDFNQVVNIVQKSLSPWTIPNIVAFGPQLVLSGAASASLKALGQFESGVTFSWPNAQAVVDFANIGGSYATGWTPMITTKAQAAGGFSAMASLGIPVALAIQLNLLNGKVVLGAGITDTPVVTGNAQAGFSFSAGSGGSPTCSVTGANGCSGISYSIDTGNSLDFTADIQGRMSMKNLASYQGPNLASGCIQVPLPSSCSNSRLTRFFERGTSPALRPEPETVVYNNKRQSNSDSNSTTSLQANYANCMDQTGQIGMYPMWNGNIFVAAANATNLTMLTGDTTLMSLTTSHGEVMYGDSQERVLHYFPDTMSSMGVSRLRLATWANLPKTSRLITLAPITVNKITMLMAIDAAGKSYWLFNCAIQGQVNKMFIVNNASTAAATLQGKNAQWTVTGGVASNCVPVSFKM
jgi:hypothetical protein